MNSFLYKQHTAKIYWKDMEYLGSCVNRFCYPGLLSQLVLNYKLLQMPFMTQGCYLGLIIYKDKTKCVNC